MESEKSSRRASVYAEIHTAEHKESGYGWGFDNGVGVKIGMPGGESIYVFVNTDGNFTVTREPHYVSFKNQKILARGILDDGDRGITVGS